MNIIESEASSVYTEYSKCERVAYSCSYYCIDVIKDFPTNTRRQVVLKYKLNKGGL